MLTYVKSLFIAGFQAIASLRRDTRLGKVARHESGILGFVTSIDRVNGMEYMEITHLDGCGHTMDVSGAFTAEGIMA